MEELLWKGFVIGILVSAPMGPIGVLIIQRTLNKGRLHGFFSGIGALFSDLIYAFITASGLGFVIGFLNSHEIMIKLLGSLIMAIFGIYLARSNPSKSLPNDATPVTTYRKDTITAFFLTLSNPLVIFLFIGLFARFNFFQEGCTLFEHIAGLLAIGGGAMCWWLFISFVFDKVRNKFNIRKLYLINKITGWVIIGFGAVGMALGLVDAYNYLFE